VDLLDHISQVTAGRIAAASVAKGHTPTRGLLRLIVEPHTSQALCAAASASCWWLDKWQDGLQTRKAAG
jgi:hypothetical protein